MEEAKLINYFFMKQFSIEMFFLWNWSVLRIYVNIEKKPDRNLILYE